MSFFSQLFRRKTAEQEPPAAVAASADPAKDPNLIRVFDAYGREMFITKQAWRDDVLNHHLQKVWSDPDQLSPIIIQSLQDGFGADMVKPAEHLAEIDPNAERGAVVLALVYREKKRLDEAERVLRRHIERHGESGVVLTNLAQIDADRGRHDEALRMLWRGLELDPNQEIGLGWYVAIFRDKAGEAAAAAAMRRIAALPNSWRARLWLGRDALAGRQLNDALALYDQALALVPRPVPTDFLQQLSGDLGKHGHLPELLRLSEPFFEIEVHGLAVGNNLIKALLDLGRLDAARELIDRHYARKRLDWKTTLSFWDGELAKARVSIASPASAEKLSVAMLSGDGPIWLPDESPAAELFRVPTGSPLRVAFLGSTAETSRPRDVPIHQMSDTPGRISRALPLFLAEQVRFGGGAEVRTFVPWLQGDSPAFVLSGGPWKAEDAATHARLGDAPADYLVLTHVKAATDPWMVELRLVRTIDARCLDTAAATFSAAEPEAGLRKLARDLLRLLETHADYVPAPWPQFYRVPDGADFAMYLIRLEQSLAVRCAAIEKVADEFLTGEREILDGDLHLCLNHPQNTVVRLVLVETLRRMKKVRPRIVEEFSERVRLLQRSHPLAAVPQAVVDRILLDIFS